MKKLTKLIKSKAGLSTFTPMWFILTIIAITFVILLICLNI